MACCTCHAIEQTLPRPKALLAAQHACASDAAVLLQISLTAPITNSTRWRLALQRSLQTEKTCNHHTSAPNCTGVSFVKPVHHARTNKKPLNSITRCSQKGMAYSPAAQPTGPLASASYVSSSIQFTPMSPLEGCGLCYWMWFVRICTCLTAMPAETGAAPAAGRGYSTMLFAQPPLHNPQHLMQHLPQPLRLLHLPHANEAAFASRRCLQRVQACWRCCDAALQTCNVLFTQPPLQKPQQSLPHNNACRDRGRAGAAAMLTEDFLKCRLPAATAQPTASNLSSQ